MDKKLIIFDKDGTLLDFDSYWLPVSEAALSELVSIAGVEKDVVSEIFEAFEVKNGVTAITSSLCHGTYDDMGHDIYEVLKKHSSPLCEQEVKKLTRELYHRHMDKGERKPTSEKLAATLDALKRGGFILGVVTTDAPLVTEECLKALGIRNFFSFIISDDGCMPTKPNPKSLEIIREEYSLSESEILMVGDTLTDVSYAKAGGVQVVGIAKSEENAKILKDNGADFVISEASEILAILSQQQPKLNPF